MNTKELHSAKRRSPILLTDDGISIELSAVEPNGPVKNFNEREKAQRGAESNRRLMGVSHAS